MLGRQLGHVGNVDEPLRLGLLERALATGGGFRDWIEHDSDLDSLRALPRYREIMARLDLRKSEAM